MNPDNIGAWTTGGFVLEDATVEELKIRVKNRFHRELVIEKDAIPADARINYCSYRPEQSGVNNVMKIYVPFTVRDMKSVTTGLL